MLFYSQTKDERANIVARIDMEIAEGIASGSPGNFFRYFADQDTYIRKAGYLAVGKYYKNNPARVAGATTILHKLMQETDAKIRQTAVNAAGEIAKYDFGVVQEFFDIGLFDSHHSVRNAVIGSIKKAGEKNPEPVIEWARKYLHHADKEIRREICHGIELRGRTHPQDILPLLKELQFDATKRVRWTLVHVLGQIAYKKGCLQTVVNEILTWENRELANDAIAEIIDVHHRYRNFSFYTQDEAQKIVADIRARY